MEVHVDRDAFLKALQLVHNLVEPRQTLPILANVLLEADGDSLRLTATDLEVAARVVSLPAQVVKPGAITLSARKLARDRQGAGGGAAACSACRRMPGSRFAAPGPRTSSSDSARRISPASRVWSRRAGCPLDGRVLRGMLGQTSFAMSQDESRYALNGILFSAQDGELRLVATDGHRLALASRLVGCETGIAATGSCRARPSTRSSGSSGPASPCEIGMGENHFVLQMPNVLLLSRLIEGTFPNYEQVVPEGHPHRLVLGARRSSRPCAGSPCSPRSARGRSRSRRRRGDEADGLPSGIRRGRGGLTGRLRGRGHHHRLQLEVPARCARRPRTRSRSSSS